MSDFITQLKNTGGKYGHKSGMKERKIKKRKKDRKKERKKDENTTFLRRTSVGNRLFEKNTQECGIVGNSYRYYNLTRI